MEVQKAGETSSRRRCGGPPHEVAQGPHRHLGSAPKRGVAAKAVSEGAWDCRVGPGLGTASFFHQLNCCLMLDPKQ